MNPAQEFVAYSGRFERRCREKGWLHALFHAGVLSDIAADLRDWLQRKRKEARRVERLDRTAEQEIHIGKQLMAQGDTLAALTHFRKAEQLCDEAAALTRNLETELTA